ncbi:Transcriptional regulator DsbA [compost metagenome]
MSIIETGNYEHLTPSDIEAIKAAAKERSGALLRIDAEKELMKEITTKVKEEFQIKPGDFNALAAMYHKQDVAAKKAQFENRVELFEKVFGDIEEPDEAEDE